MHRKLCRSLCSAQICELIPRLASYTFRDIWPESHVCFLPVHSGTEKVATVSCAAAQPAALRCLHASAHLYSLERLRRHHYWHMYTQSTFNRTCTSLLKRWLALAEAMQRNSPPVAVLFAEFFEAKPMRDQAFKFVTPAGSADCVSAQHDAVFGGRSVDSGALPPAMMLPSQFHMASGPPVTEVVSPVQQTSDNVAPLPDGSAWGNCISSIDLGDTRLLINASFTVTLISLCA